MRLFLLFVVVLLSGTTAWAQDDAPKLRTARIGEPSSIGVAMIGTVVVASGVGLMLYQPRCTIRCDSNGPYIAGGMVVVAAGVTLVYLGLRPRTVIIAPLVGPRAVGLTATIRLRRFR